MCWNNTPYMLFSVSMYFVTIQITKIGRGDLFVLGKMRGLMHDQRDICSIVARNICTWQEADISTALQIKLSSLIHLPWIILGMGSANERRCCIVTVVSRWLCPSRIIPAYHAKYHDDVIKWKHFPRYWPFVRGIHRSPVNSPHKGQWRGALMFTLICARINGWVNNREAGDLRRYRAHYDVIVMFPRKYKILYLYFRSRPLYSGIKRAQGCVLNTVIEWTPI